MSLGVRTDEAGSEGGKMRGRESRHTHFHDEVDEGGSLKVVGWMWDIMMSGRRTRKIHSSS